MFGTFCPLAYKSYWALVNKKILAAAFKVTWIMSPTPTCCTRRLISIWLITLLRWYRGEVEMVRCFSFCCHHSHDQWFLKIWNMKSRVEKNKNRGCTSSQLRLIIALHKRKQALNWHSIGISFNFCWLWSWSAFLFSRSMDQATKAPPSGMHEVIPEVGKLKTAGLDNGPRISTKDEQLIFEYCQKCEALQLRTLLSDAASVFDRNARDEQG